MPLNKIKAKAVIVRKANAEKNIANVFIQEFHVVYPVNAKIALMVLAKAMKQ